MAAAPLTVTGGATANVFYLRGNADLQHLDVWTNSATPGSGTPSQSVLVSNITTVAVTGSASDDTLTVDFANGDPFPSTVLFAAGTGSNKLVLSGLKGSAVAIGGSTATFGPTVVTYTGVQFLTVNGSADNDTLTQTSQPTAAVVFNGGAGSDTLNVNGGEFVFGGNPVGATADLTVNDNAAVYFAGAVAGTGINPRVISALNLSANATATLDSPAVATDRAVLVVSVLSIDPAARLDLGTNDLIVHNGNLSTISSTVGSAFATGTGTGPWKGAGTTSVPAASATQAALGIVLNASGATGTVTSSFDNQPVVRTDVLVKFTNFGDANLDGRVDGSDYTKIDAGFNSHLTGWMNGDFNYDGVVDGSDYTLIDNVFNTQSAGDSLVQKLQYALAVAQQQAVKTVGEIGTSSNYPQYTNPDGSWSWVSATHWTAGMLPGTLWELYQATGNPYFKTQATKFTTPLSVDQHDTTDVGFKIYDSFYPLLQQTPGDAGITQIMLNAAASKATQFNSTVGAFKAWRGTTSGNPLANFNVLMDLIMDSNLLFWAAKNTTGTLSQTYYNEAVSNAVVEQTYLVRPDGGSAQFAYFNSANGQFIDNETYEGYSASSTWSRGQAWGIYGFTLCAQQSGRADFLATAEKMADYFISHEPADHVPYWDFNAPNIPDTYRDSSAAAVAASGMLSLSKLIAGTDPFNSARYRSAAADILSSLASPAYLNDPAAAANGLLLHGALNVPQKTPVGPDSSIQFGDYYFIEAALHYLAG